MANTFFGLSIGTSGLYAYQAAINTTAHNIANAGTDGYSRQVAMRQASKPLSAHSTYGMIGTGVDVTEIKQIRSLYFDEKYWKNNSVYGEYNSKSYYMTQIGNYFNDFMIKGFSDAYTTLFTKSLSELHKDPTSSDARTKVINDALNLTEIINSTARNLKTIQEETNFEIKNNVDRINSLSEQIASITKQINAYEVTGSTANDLRDQRAVLVDELSEIATVTVKETKLSQGDEPGATSYMIRIDGQILVDSDRYNTLKVVPRDYKLSQNDAEGLYDIQWSTGADFSIKSSNLSGKLKALIELRDGNNNQNFTGTGSTGVAGNTVGSTKLVVEKSNIDDINKINFSDTGVIKVGNKEYKYDSFEVKVNPDGSYEYTFDLKEPLLFSAEGASIEIGDDIDYKGIPYYMSELNEMIRTFSQKFNSVHNQGTGTGEYANPGLDFFNAKDSQDGSTGNLDETVGKTTGFKSSDHTYYSMTVENFTVTEAIVRDINLIMTASDPVNGSNQVDILEKLMEIRTDKSLFKEGTMESFYNTLYAEIGVDEGKSKSLAESQNNIITSITNQRLSISGVDEDEEAMNLIKFKHAYDLSSKVISVMNEIYEKLINQTGV